MPTNQVGPAPPSNIPLTNMNMGGGSSLMGNVPLGNRLGPPVGRGLIDQPMGLSSFSLGSLNSNDLNSLNNQSNSSGMLLQHERSRTVVQIANVSI